MHLMNIPFDPKKYLSTNESGNTKKGKHSVAVAKQYCGNVGKIENSQVAVYASLGNSDFSTLVDSKLYLPEQWTKDKKRVYEFEYTIKKFYKTYSNDVIRQEYLLRIENLKLNSK